jgi:hypothetical protein
VRKEERGRRKEEGGRRSNQRSILANRDQIKKRPFIRCCRPLGGTPKQTFLVATANGSEGK